MNDKIKISDVSCKKNSCQPIEVPTKDEVKALTALREIKNRVREIKKMLSGMSLSDEKEGSNEKRELEEEMKLLKSEWKKWEEKKEAAARERMILLGHKE